MLHLILLINFYIFFQHDEKMLGQKFDIRADFAPDTV